MNNTWQSMSPWEYTTRREQASYLESEFLATPEEAVEMRQKYFERLRAEHYDSSVTWEDDGGRCE